MRHTCAYCGMTYDIDYDRTSNWYTGSQNSGCVTDLSASIEFKCPNCGVIEEREASFKSTLVEMHTSGGSSEQCPFGDRHSNCQYYDEECDDCKRPYGELCALYV